MIACKPSNIISSNEAPQEKTQNLTNEISNNPSTSSEDLTIIDVSDDPNTEEILELKDFIEPKENFEKTSDIDKSKEEEVLPIKKDVDLIKGSETSNTIATPKINEWLPFESKADAIQKYQETFDIFAAQAFDDQYVPITILSKWTILKQISNEISAHDYFITKKLF